MAHNNRSRLTEDELTYIKANCKEKSLQQISTDLNRNHTTVRYWYQTFKLELKPKKVIVQLDIFDPYKSKIQRPPAIYSNTQWI